MNDDDEMTQWAQRMQPETVERVNGFAKGDRVAIVSGSYKGAYGRVEHSSVGCHPEWCGMQDGGNCKLIFIDLTHVPKELGPHVLKRRSFRVSEVTHID